MISDLSLVQISRTRISQNFQLSNFVNTICEGKYYCFSRAHSPPVNLSSTLCTRDTATKTNVKWTIRWTTLSVEDSMPHYVNWKRGSIDLKTKIFCYFAENLSQITTMRANNDIFQLTSRHRQSKSDVSQGGVHNEVRVIWIHTLQVGTHMSQPMRDRTIRLTMERGECKRSSGRINEKYGTRKWTAFRKYSSYSRQCSYRYRYYFSVARQNSSSG